MKLASLRQGGRDGTLIVVSKHFKRGIKVPEIAATMQNALDNWETIAPKLDKVYQELLRGDLEGQFPLDFSQLAAPLPRAYQWCDSSVYLNHIELLRMSRKLEVPQSLYEKPLMYQGGSDQLQGPRDPILAIDEDWGIDLEAEVAIITDDVPMGTSAEDAAKHIKLVMIANDVSYRNLINAEQPRGFGFFQSKPATAFSPVAVTLDELGDKWDGGKLSLPLKSEVNGETLGAPNAGEDLYFDFPRLIEHAAFSRDLGAGTIVGSGTVSNRDRSRGSACLMEVRALELIDHGEARSPFLSFGDTVRIEMHNELGESIFGAIEQKVEKYAV